MPAPHELCIVSWNMLYSNKKQDEAFAFIEALPFDVLCLQEVPNEFLPRLQLLPYYIVSCLDQGWTNETGNRPEGETLMHLAIVSRFPISHSETFLLPTFPPPTIPALLFNQFLRAIGHLKGSARRERNALVGDCEMGTETIRIICYHASVTTIALRSEELELLWKVLPTKDSCVICGDFNTLESWFWKPWNWLRGGRLRDAFPWNSERRMREKEFATHQLSNPLRGNITHPLTQSQLDHILVPIGTQITSKKILPRHGSDHHPVAVTIEINELEFEKIG